MKIGMERGDFLPLLTIEWTQQELEKTILCQESERGSPLKIFLLFKKRLDLKRVNFLQNLFFSQMKGSHFLCHFCVQLTYSSVLSSSSTLSHCHKRRIFGKEMVRVLCTTESSPCPN